MQIRRGVIIHFWKIGVGHLQMCAARHAFPDVIAELTEFRNEFIDGLLGLGFLLFCL
jgi:hypothetical protein